MEGGENILAAIQQQQVIALLLAAEIKFLSGHDSIPFCRIEIPDVIASAGDGEKIGIGAADQSVLAGSTAKDVFAGTSFEGVSSPMSAQQIIS